MIARFLLLVTIALVLAGCAALRDMEAERAVKPEETAPPGEAADQQARLEPEAPPSRVEVPAPLLAGDLERLLVYFEQVKKLPTVELGREHDSARAAFTRTRSDFDRMRLAMVVSIPNTALSDDQRAVELLEPVVKNQNSSLRGLASLMSAHLQERRRLESGMHSLQQNVQGLQQKLDALMSLERSLIDREQSSPARKR